jgi:acetoin utilization deacetylase AcuC-like enzyme
VDIDVHHGNGTQAIFYRDPRVLYASTHQHPFYPGTGAVTEVGEGPGRGFTVNVPMEAGCGDADYALVYDAIVQPILMAFRPQLLLVSAGFDAHERDPLASMRLTTRGYGATVKALVDVAAVHGSLALVTEGGYELSALASCLEKSFAAVDGSHAALHAHAMDATGARRGAEAVAAARQVLKPYWPGI